MFAFCDSGVPHLKNLGTPNGGNPRVDPELNEHIHWLPCVLLPTGECGWG